MRKLKKYKPTVFKASDSVYDKNAADYAVSFIEALTRNNDVWELGIADIAVGKGVVSLSSGNITDTRLNASLCGLVNSLVSAVYE